MKNRLKVKYLHVSLPRIFAGYFCLPEEKEKTILILLNCYFLINIIEEVIYNI